jgi:glycosidase
VLFCVAGVPSVYYGDEQGFRGLKEHREGGDDEIRPPFPASPADLPPGGWPTYRLHQRLIGFRRRHPWLVRARTVAEHIVPSALALRMVAADGASADGEGQVLLLLNAGDEPHWFPVDQAGLGVALTAEAGVARDDPLTVPAHSWTILA